MSILDQDDQFVADDSFDAEAPVTDAPAPMTRAQYARGEIARCAVEFAYLQWDDDSLARLAELLQPGQTIDVIGADECRFGPPSQPGLYGFRRLT